MSESEHTASVCHRLPNWGRAWSQTPAPTDDRRCRRGRRCRTIDRLARILTPRTGEPAHARSRPARRGEARLRTQPGGAGARVRTHQDHRSARPGHHQPVLLGSHQGCRTCISSSRAHSRSRRHPGEPRPGGTAPAPPRTHSGWIRRERTQAPRRRAPPGRGAQCDHPGQPGDTRNCLRRRRLRQRDGADRRSSCVVGPRIIRVRRRTGRVVVRGSQVARTTPGGKEARDERTEIRPVHTHARGGTRCRRRRARLRSNRRGLPQRHARDRPPGQARRTPRGRST